MSPGRWNRATIYLEAHDALYFGEIQKSSSLMYTIPPYSIYPF
jgi:hypothetical protein